MPPERAPFRDFLDTQRAFAAYVLVALILGMFLISTALTLQIWAQAGVSVWNIEAAFAAIKNNSPIALVRLGSTLRPLIEQGELWRLMAANYLHAGLLHVFVNAYSVVALGPFLEKIFGTPRFLAIWVVSGTSGALASSWVHVHAASVGASGALFGLLGAMLSLGIRFRGAIPRHETRAIRDVALIMLGINLILGMSIPNVDNTAHLGGLFGGMITAFLLGPHPALLREPRETGQQPRWLWVFPIMALIAVVWGLVFALSGRVPVL
ncbi:MAG: rhomboid family intramembrane serine protease [Candidatus Sericytochromatia bacterium]|nr:rhomboid family intramembrane serine protease [Candidatus Sericytochromatia bacterium]